jgi:predicted nucleotidyltransferase/DNA-binding XRE family transcriptional regulator
MSEALFHQYVKDNSYWRNLTPIIEDKAQIDYPNSMDIKKLRKSKGLSQKEAAALLSIPPKTYQNYELGRSALTSLAGRMIVASLTAYEPYSETHGIYPLTELTAILSDFFKDYDISWAYLFGSYAKGTAKETSDIDLLVDSSITGLAFFGLAGKLETLLHKKVDLLRFQDLSKNPDLLSEILKTGCRIYVRA